MKTLIYPLFAIILLLNISCDTDIPEEDNTPPTFSINISTEDFEYSFDQDDNIENIQLNVTNNLEYTISFTGFDKGGVKSMQLQYTRGGFIEFTSDINDPWSQSQFNDYNDIIQWQGDSSDPKTGSLFFGEFIPRGLGFAVELKFIIQDFGGDSGDVNETQKTLLLYINDHESEVINL